MKIFCTGASGYIGGSVAAHLVAAGHQVTGLVRSAEKAEAVRALGIEPVMGTLDDAEILRRRRRRPTSSSMPRAPITRARSSACSVRSPEAASRSSTPRDRACRHALQRRAVRCDLRRRHADTPSPARVARVALNEFILSYRDKGCCPVIICPSLIYGSAMAPAGQREVPLLIKLARKRGNAAHAGPGENIWSNVHIDDLVPLYALAIEKAPAGGVLFLQRTARIRCARCARPSTACWVYRGRQRRYRWRKRLPNGARAPAEDTMASNSRVRAKRARQLGWKPKARSLFEEIEHGCYRE